MADHVQAGHERRRAAQRDLVRHWHRAGALREGLGPAEAGDVLWALTSPELYLLHVRGSGWSPARYERWLDRTPSPDRCWGLDSPVAGGSTMPVMERPEPDLLVIGRFARLVGLSVGALRHYDELGLLRPAWVDPDAGYRSYRRDQLAAARTIVRLRGLEVPLDTIRAWLATDDAAARQRLIADHRTRIEARTIRLQRVLHILGQPLAASPTRPGGHAREYRHPARPDDRPRRRHAPRARQGSLQPRLDTPRDRGPQPRADRHDDPRGARRAAGTGPGPRGMGRPRRPAASGNARASTPSWGAASLPCGMPVAASPSTKRPQAGRLGRRRCL